MTELGVERRMPTVDDQYGRKFFQATAFVLAGYESSSGEWGDSDRKDIAALREFYPELSHWGDLAIGSAFGSFSQDVLEVSWADWMLEKRDEIFLNYCCWVQTRGAWSLGLNEVILGSVSREWKHAIGKIQQ